MNKKKRIVDNLTKAGELLKEVLDENRMIKHSNQAFIEHSEDVVLIVDANTRRIIYANTMAKEKYGELIGKPCCDIIFIPRVIFKLDKYKNAIYNPKLKKVLYIVAKRKIVDSKELIFIRIIDLNGETKLFVKLANKYNIV